MSVAELQFIDESRESVELFPGPLVVGRDPDCDRSIKHEKISKRHAEIWRDQDHHWYIRDLGSTNGSFVNRERVTDVTRIAPGDLVHLGAVGFRFHAEASAAPVSPPSAAPPRARTHEQPGPPPQDAMEKPSAPTRPRMRRIPRNEMARFAWGVAVVLLCIYGGLEAWRRIGPGARTNTAAHDPQTPAADGPRGSGPRVGPLPRANQSGMPQPRPDVSSITAPPGEANQTQAGAIPRGVPVTPSTTKLTEGPNGTTTPRDAAPPAMPSGQATTRKAPAPVPIDSPPVSSDPTATKVPPADPVLGLLERGDVAALARHLSSSPQSKHARAIREFLTAAPIVAVKRSGRLSAAGESHVQRLLTRHYPRLVTTVDASVLTTLPFATTVIRRTLHIRFRHDYETGLGRRVGGGRLAPHPKQITVALLSPEGDKAEELFEIDGKTPHLSDEKLSRETGGSEEGMTEEAVWELTLAALLPTLEKALQKDAELLGR